jgi:hypothetical protein
MVALRVASARKLARLVKALAGEAETLVWILAVCRGVLYQLPFSLPSFYSL